MKDRCRRTAGLLDVLMADGDLTADELAHVAGCPACARVVAEARAFERALTGLAGHLTGEPIADPEALQLAHDIHRPKEMTMRIRPSLGLVAAIAGASLAIISLFILRPPSADPPLTAGGSASATPASSPVVVPPPGAPVVTADEAARILGVAEGEVLLVPNGAVAARRDGAMVTLVGVGADRRSIPLTVVAPATRQGEAADSDVSGVVCATGPFAGDAFLLSATRVQGTPSLPGAAARILASPVTVDGVRTIVAALDTSDPRRTWAVRLADGTGGTGYGGSFVSVPCDGSDPSAALAAAAQATSDDQALAQRATDAGRALVPGTDALVAVEACGDVPLVRFWAPEASSGGHIVLGDQASAQAPDGPGLADLRARRDLPCRPLPAPLTAHDAESVPNVDRVRSVLAEEHGFTSVRQLQTAYLGATTLVVGAHADPFLSTSGGNVQELEYVAIVRRSASGDWDAITVRSAEHMDGFAGIGGIRLGLAEGLDGSYVAVYGVPFTIDPVVVELEVDGTAYQYPIGADGFLAVVPADVAGPVTYRYLARDGRVVESGDVALD